MAKVTVFRVYCFHKVTLWVFWWHTKPNSLAQLPTNPVPIKEDDMLKIFDTFGSIFVSLEKIFLLYGYPNYFVYILHKYAWKKCWKIFFGQIFSGAGTRQIVRKYFWMQQWYLVYFQLVKKNSN